MKKYFTSIIYIHLFSTTLVMAQTDSLKVENNDIITTSKVKLEKVDNVIFRLFPTENMWTFIKLNTRNGKMWQVQYDVKGDDRLETYLNISPLVSAEKEVTGRFTLYSTQNHYTFILLDQIDGKMWQVQWSIEPEWRGIYPIE